MADLEARTDHDIELLAGELHERARTLTQLIQGPPRLTRPEAARTILGNLAQTSYRILQVAEQIDAFLDHELGAGRLGCRDGQDLTVTVLRAHDALAVAVEQGLDVGEAFRRAQRALVDIHGAEADEEPARTEEAEKTVAETQDPSAGGVVPAARDFPQAIEDVLPRPSLDSPSSARRPTPRPPSPRREL